MGRLDDKVAVITGAGLCIAQAKEALDPASV